VLVAVTAGSLALPGIAWADAITVAITSPSSGSTVIGPVEIVAETTGPVISVTFDVSMDAGTTWLPIGTDTDPSDRWSVSWEPGSQGGSATLRALATDGVDTETATVAVRLEPAAAPVSVSLSRSAFSPNGDGRADQILVRIHLHATAVLTLRVLGDGGAALRTLLEAVPSGPDDLVVPWSGEGADGRTLPDDRYRIVLRVTDERGNVWSTRSAVVLDTRAPRPRRFSVRPDPYRGVGSVRFAFRVPDRGPRVNLVAVVADAGGHRIAALPPIVHRPGVIRLDWDGLDARARPALPGLHTVTVRVRDDAGNVDVSKPYPFRDHRPVTSRPVRSAERAGDRVALTFDDCYDVGAWQRILSALAASDAGGSFFCLGPNVLAHPALARRTVAAGHTIGAHGWDHANASSLSASHLRDRVRREAAAWWQVARATSVPFYRPAYGEYDPEALRAVGDEGYAFTVLWDVDPSDWSRPGASSIVSRVVSHARSGSIVVLHVTDQTASALPALIRGLRDRGLELATLAELLGGS
jgi:peptidoglycan/xylan/chitin deacetylase (PgdA/CDA1 family)